MLAAARCCEEAGQVGAGYLAEGGQQVRPLVGAFEPGLQHRALQPDVLLCSLGLAVYDDAVHQAVVVSLRVEAQVLYPDVSGHASGTLCQQVGVHVHRDALALEPLGQPQRIEVHILQCGLTFHPLQAAVLGGSTQLQCHFAVRVAQQRIGLQGATVEPCVKVDGTIGVAAVSEVLSHSVYPQVWPSVLVLQHTAHMRGQRYALQVVQRPCGCQVSHSEVLQSEVSIQQARAHQVASYACFSQRRLQRQVGLCRLFRVCDIAVRREREDAAQLVGLLLQLLGSPLGQHPLRPSVCMQLADVSLHLGSPLREANASLGIQQLLALGRGHEQRLHLYVPVLGLQAGLEPVVAFQVPQLWHNRCQFRRAQRGTHLASPHIVARQCARLPRLGLRILYAYLRVRQREPEVLKPDSLAPHGSIALHVLQPQAARLGERKPFQCHLHAVAPRNAEPCRGVQVADVQVGRIQPSRCLSGVEPVVPHLASPQQQAADADVRLSLTTASLQLLGQELEVVWPVLLSLVYHSPSAHQLNAANAHTVAQQWQQLHLQHSSPSLQHQRVALVAYLQVLQRHSSRHLQSHGLHACLHAQLLRQPPRGHTAHTALYRRDTPQQNQQQADDCQESCHHVEYVFQPVHSLFLKRAHSAHQRLRLRKSTK